MCIPPPPDPGDRQPEEVNTDRCLREPSGEASRGDRWDWVSLTDLLLSHNQLESLPDGIGMSPIDVVYSPLNLTYIKVSPVPFQQMQNEAWLHPL